MSPMTNGFVVKKSCYLPEVRSTVTLLEHTKSGALLFHLHNDDSENLMSIGFRTPPSDNTGVFHIIEHTCLSGSRKFPVKDVFIELMKTSLATFLNAMTYQDKTLYPCASLNKKDFANLVSVYLDSVFNPLLTEEAFMQERQIVYNEMKGAFSSLDEIIGRHVARGLFDNSYGFETGGIPADIKGLTFSQFKITQLRYYHPSNSLIFAYGNLPVSAHTKLFSSYLDRFDKLAVDAVVPATLPWTKQKKIVVLFTADQTNLHKFALTHTWYIGSITDAETLLATKLFEIYLLDNDASPLRHALITSHLGSNLTESGYGDYQRETYFTVGLKGIKEKDLPKVSSLIKKTLLSIHKSGFDGEMLNSAFHRLEIQSKEIDARYPLTLMDRVYNTWTYDASAPDYYLHLNSHFDKLKKLHQSNPSHLCQIFEKLFVKNPHLVIHTFSPEKSKTNTESSQESTKPQTQNTPAALATLPKLSLKDLDKKGSELSTTVIDQNHSVLLTTDIFTNGLNYFNLALDLSHLQGDLLIYLPLFVEGLSQMGAGDRDYLEMAKAEAKLGSFGASVSASGTALDFTDTKIYLQLHAKALDTQFPSLIELITSRLLTPNFTDLTRLKEIILRDYESLESSVVEHGNSFAASFVAKKLNRTARVNETFTGINQLRFLSNLAHHFDTEGPLLLEKFHTIHQYFLSHSALIGSFAGSSPNRIVVSGFLESLKFAEKLSSSNPETDHTIPPFRKVGLYLPSDVSFNALVLPGCHICDPLSASLKVLSHTASFGYLYERVRAAGGAYGVSLSPDFFSGTLTFSSYRDPHINQTISTFENFAKDPLSNLDLSHKVLSQAIIGSFRSLDRPIRSGLAVDISLNRYLYGSTPEIRQEFRNRLLSVTKTTLTESLDKFLVSQMRNRQICSISSETLLKTANTEASEEFSLESV